MLTEHDAKSFKDKLGRTPADLVLLVNTRAGGIENDDDDEIIDIVDPVWQRRFDQTKGFITLVWGFVQMAAFAFNLDLPWPDKFAVSAVPFQVTQDVVSFSLSYTILFWLTVSALYLTFGVLHFFYIRTRKIGTFLSWLVFDILYIPILRILFAAFACERASADAPLVLLEDETLACLDTSHWIKISLAAFSLVVYIPVVVRFVRVDYQAENIAKIYTVAWNNDFKKLKKTGLHRMTKRAQV